jgi:hypothetical protein
MSTRKFNEIKDLERCDVLMTAATPRRALFGAAVEF